MTYHDAVVMPVLMFAELHTVAEAADAKVKVAADSASYPDGIRDVAAARVAVIFNTRLSYISPTTIDSRRRVTWFQRKVCVLVGCPSSIKTLFAKRNLRETIFREKIDIMTYKVNNWS